MKGEAQSLEILLAQIQRDGEAPIGAWPSGELEPEDIGLTITAGRLSWQDAPDVLDAQALTDLLPELQVEVRQIVSSTNTLLVEAAHDLDRRLILAEFQSGGRGRRGRRWLSPYARNLAMSLGLRTSRSLSELGGLSSVVGLAIASELERLRVKNVALKWPNDVLVGDEKICGILVELVQDAEGVGVVVGCGVNVSLQDHERVLIDQPVTDLRAHGVTHSRTELAGALAGALWRFLQHFEAQGFGPFQASFDAVHKFHHQQCTVLQGEHKISGTVVGLGPHGELMMRTDSGLQSFHGGEVSLRPSLDVAP